MKIAYQGEPGAFSEAASRLVSADAMMIPCKAFEEVFEKVEQGPAQYGVLPIENSIGGSIHRNYDLLMENHLPIVGEVELPVVHHLLALPGATLQQIKRVYSHPQPIAQCERFLRTLTGVEIIATYDTAGSAKMVQDGKLTDTAAIASAARVFDSGLQRQHHAFHRHRPASAERRGARQDDDRVLPAERAGIAVQGAERVCAARRQRDEARVASDSRPAVGIPLLCRPRVGA
jgi:hypothetical protein